MTIRPLVTALRIEHGVPAARRTSARTGGRRARTASGQVSFFRSLGSRAADPARAGGYGWGQMSHSLAWVYEVSGLRPASCFCFDGKSEVNTTACKRLFSLGCVAHADGAVCQVGVDYCTPLCPMKTSKRRFC